MSRTNISAPTTHWTSPIILQRHLNASLPISPSQHRPHTLLEPLVYLNRPIQIQKPHHLPQMIKSPETLLFTLFVLTLIPRDPKCPQTHRLISILAQPPLRLLAAHSFQQIFRDVFPERFFEDGTEALGFPDEVIPITPERGVKSVEGGGDGLGRRDLQGAESALGVQG